MSAAPTMQWRYRSADDLDMLVAEIARLLETEYKRVLIARGRMGIACTMTQPVRAVAVERAKNLVQAASHLTEYAELWETADAVLGAAEQPLYGNVPKFFRGRLTDRIVAVLLRGTRPEGHEGGHDGH